MKVVVEERGSVTRQQMADKMQRILDLVSQQSDEDRCLRLAALARALLTHAPFHYLDTISESEMLAWLQTFLDFIEGRRETVAVQRHDLDRGGSYFLMTNTSDGVHLLDSVQGVLNRRGDRFHVVSHPILTVRRENGKVVYLGDLAEPGPKESFILIEVDPGEQAGGIAMENDVRDVLLQALRADSDSKKLKKALKELGKSLDDEQDREFFVWLQKNNFHLYGARIFTFQRDSRGVRFERRGDPLGIDLTGTGFDLAQGRLEELPPAPRDFFLRQSPLVVEATDLVSPVHRSEPLQYIGFRQPVGPDSWVEYAFFGLFSQHSTNEPIHDLPVLYRKVKRALTTLHIPDGCYDERKAVEIFNTFPRVELFFLGEDEIARLVRSFISLQPKDSVKVVVARGLALKSLTLLLIMPRDYYSTGNLHRVENHLCRYFKSSGVNSRLIHAYADYMSLHVSLRPGSEDVHVDIDRLERVLTGLVRTWDERLRRLLERLYGSQRKEILWHRFGQGFSDEYRAFCHPRFAVRDLLGLERLAVQGEDHFDLWGPFSDSQGMTYRLHFYSLRESTLNDLMPILENLNLCVLEEVDFVVKVEGRNAFIKSFSLRSVEGQDGLPLSTLKPKLLEALDAIWCKAAENDYLNRLLPLTGLSWKEIDIFRGYRNYYFQLGTPFTKKRVAFALIHNPQVAILLVRYFTARFRPDAAWQDPMVREEEALSPLRLELVQALEGVDDINEDRILRGLFNLIDSTVRTNFFRRSPESNYFFAFKISAIGIIDMVFPRPLYEIYVHSATMEGIHLRGGKVARGGIRWSDRPDDFRTEVLGLMKTQMTKNTLIVPVGSKGGFVVKTPYRTREEGMTLAKEAYQSLMRGLLDLTDNRQGREIVRSPDIVAYDDVDPYLVVAADKGTAHLPDTANAVSAEYRYWLGDAFASGGSHGYDHKELGITARGAWECVKRHFREMDIDIQTEPFTVIGIGDMSGDVFGNGMLLSRQIRLLAAFDHRHIFIDPDPDPQRSFQERQRLFDLPRSSWEDYDSKLLSTGGGIWPRSSKDIRLSPQIRSWLGVRHDTIDGDGLVSLLLAASADLLWNGGIGTYVKASTEKHEDVGDRANDAVRVDANELQVKVIGEGGNLGMTQKARIEYALAGGLINTDAIDNSAGVDSSDHEVNLKIFMQYLMGEGKVQDLEARDRLLREMTDEVCDSVLANNYTQSLSLSLDQLRCQANVEVFLDLADRLVNGGLLDRQSESLPGRKEIMSRDPQAFTRPELSILLAYSKMQLFEALLESSLPDESGGRDLLQTYFPRSLQDRFSTLLEYHPLAREITATVMTNRIHDQGGSTLLFALGQTTGRSIVEAARAYLFFERVLDATEVRREIFRLDNQLSAGRQYKHLLQLETTIADLCRYLLQQEGDTFTEGDVTPYRDRVRDYCDNLSRILPSERFERILSEEAEFVGEGISPPEARILASLPVMDDFLPLDAIARSTGLDVVAAATVLNTVRDTLLLPGLLAGLEKVPVRDRWDRMTRYSLKQSLIAVAYRFTRLLLDSYEGRVTTFVSRHKQQMRLYLRLRKELQETVPANFHPFTVLIRSLESLLTRDGMD